LWVIEHAHRLGIAVSLINALQLAYYRKAVGVRHKSDPHGAWLLARLLAHEADSLRPLRAPCAQAQRLWTLLKRRATVVNTRQQLQQSLSHIELSANALFAQFQAFIQPIDQRLKPLVQQLHGRQNYRRLLTIPGGGPLNAIALVAVYHRGAFANTDTFIGLDVRLRESGRFKGHCKLTKHGETEIRRLLYRAAIPARTYHLFDTYHQKQRDKGLSKIAANVALARNSARIAFALLSEHQSFIKQPDPCPSP
jgi:transposase